MRKIDRQQHPQKAKTELVVSVYLVPKMMLLSAARTLSGKTKKTTYFSKFHIQEQLSGLFRPPQRLS